MSIHISPELERRVQQYVRSGHAPSVEAFLERLVRDALNGDDDWEWLGEPAADAESRRQAVRELEELARGITLGPELTIRQLIEEGRK